MNYQSTLMTKLLTDIDNMYGSMYQKMTIRERISYCELIINMHISSAAKKIKSTGQDKSDTHEIFLAAKQELKMLTKEL